MRSKRFASQGVGSLMEGLESRVLLSACMGGNAGHGAGHTTSSAVQADMQKIKADLTKLVTDSKTARATLVADEKAVRAAMKNGVNPAVTAAQAKLDADTKALAPVVAADQAAIDAVDGQYNTLLNADQAAVDGATDPATLAALQAKLASDQQAYMSAVSVAENQLDRDQAPLINDQAALDAALAQGGGGGDPTAAKAQLAADKKAFEATWKADVEALFADQKQFAMDLRAAHSSALAAVKSVVAGHHV
ncbi:MAG TPA: hypothetical protein VH253_08355 [Phycisphaerae bacterium]|nr:hypothetical protein [Phycisphaerae bacterium]